MLATLMFVGSMSFLAAIATAVVLIYFAKRYCVRRRENEDKLSSSPRKLNVAFFHPYCNAGGGGERVLWCAVRAIQNWNPDVNIVIYTGDINASPTEIVNRAQQRFNIQLCGDIEFVYLHKRKWLEPSRYPYFTLLCQSVGSIVVGFEALASFLPDIYIDSTGFAFTLPLFSYVGGCATACYVHYPTITREMLRRVSHRVSSYNNREGVSRSPLLSSAKVIYYRLFAALYGLCGRFADTVMVNSSWTEEHINVLWKKPLSTHRIFPPCDTSTLKKLPLAKDIGSGGEIKIVSVGQYRPEKDHPLQLKAMYELRQIVSEELWDRIRLVFIGSCRDSGDEVRVKDMMDLCKHLALEENVEFKVNSSYEELQEELSTSMIGLHAMWNEHFGIGIVECMAAGQIMVAHRSGGPKADIIEEAEGSRNGFLAVDETEYAAVLATILKMTPSARNHVREAARSSVDRFSTEEFEKGFLRTIEPLFSMVQLPKKRCQ